MITRVSAAVVLAACVTLALLFTMQQMIASGMDAISEPAVMRLADAVRIERSEPAGIRRIKPTRPPLPAMRPNSPQPTISGNTAMAFDIAMTAPAFTPSIVTPAGFATAGDSDYQALVKVAPVYPELAVAKDVEGFVIIRFTVTTGGTVTDIDVVESTAPLFAQSAVRAALKFEYKPRIVGGAPVEVTGVMHKIVFTLEEPQQMAMQL